MANALTDFTKKREFLICMDSDGCVMDTVRIKHSTVMCPELIRVFALDDHADFITAAWDEINLHTITRGISRFESVRLVFDRLKNRGIEIPGSEDIAAWVDTATELSTASLQRELQKTGSLALRKLQEWNNACNRRIQALEPTFEPFPGVEESLRQLHAVADVAVVSAANESAIASEWKRYGLARHADVGVQMKSLKLQQTQEAGSIFINEVKNIIITVVAATAVIHGQMTLGMMLAVQYIIGQLNLPVEQLMNFFYSLQDVKISLERINEIHQMDDESGKEGLQTSIEDKSEGIDIKNIMFKYDPHALRKTIDDVGIHIPQGTSLAKATEKVLT